MEQVLKILIRNSEAASIELVPTEEGVEVVVLRKGKSKEKSKPSNDNLEILREFCTEKKEFHKWDATMKKELKAFWDFYSPKAEEWKGTMQPEKLWERWNETKR